MHGLIFLTFEKYLANIHNKAALEAYREAVRGTEAQVPLVSRIYPDEILIKGVGAVVEKTGMPLNMLLREYGRYFIINDLTDHLCSHVLSKFDNARDLILYMRTAHAQLRYANKAIDAPLFDYWQKGDGGLLLRYSSDRKLCAVLRGAIEGAAIRYGENVRIFEHGCVHAGEDACLFEIHFRPAQDTPGNGVLRQNGDKQRDMDDTIRSMLPVSGKGLTLHDVGKRLLLRFGCTVRPSVIINSMLRSQQEGLISAEGFDDIYSRRLYKRVEKIKEEA